MSKKQTTNVEKINEDEDLKEKDNLIEVDKVEDKITKDKKENNAPKSKKEIVKKNIKSMSIEVLTIMLGTFITALGFQIFLTPHNIVPGGFMGVAKIVYDVIARTGFTAISISTWYIILNAFLYLYAVKCLGWKFAIRAGVGIASYSLFVGLIEQTSLIDIITTQFEAEVATSYILYAIYGGVLMGTGIGLVFRGNGSTGGCDMVAVVVNKFFPTVTTGQIIIFVDGAVVILSALVYSSLVLPLYALITIFISGKVSDMFVDGIRSLRAYYIVTDKKEELSQAIFNKLNRGVTNLKCEGMFTHNDRDMLLIIVRRAQILALKKIVKKIDPNSFMFSHNVKEAYGNGFIAHANDKIKKNKKSILLKDSKSNDLNKQNESQIIIANEIDNKEIINNENKSNKIKSSKKQIVTKENGNLKEDVKLNNNKIKKSTRQKTKV